MIYDYNELRPHIGHEIECVCYGEDGEDPDNIAIECMTCGAVLIDFCKGDYIEKTLGDDEDDG